MKKLIALVLIVTMLTALAGCSTKEERTQYETALVLYEEGKYSSALNAFEASGDYKKSEKYIRTCKYYIAMQTVSPDSNPEDGYSGNIRCTADNAEQVAQAIDTLKSLDGYKSSDRIAQDAQNALDAYHTATRLARLVDTIEMQLVGYVDRCEYNNGNFYIYFDENYPITFDVVLRGQWESAVRESWTTVRSWFTDAVFEYIPDCTVYLLDRDEQMLGAYTYNTDNGETTVLMDMATKPF